MSPAEYSELAQAKERAADLHRLRKLHFRERIADAIQANPEWAYTIAQERRRLFGSNGARRHGRRS
jgi:hypothetical protein